MTVCRRMGGWVDEWMEGKKRSIASEWEDQGIKGRTDGRKAAHWSMSRLHHCGVFYIFWHHYRPEKSCLGMWLLRMALLGCCWCCWGAFVWIARIAWMDEWNLLVPNRGGNPGWARAMAEQGSKTRGKLAAMI